MTSVDPHLNQINIYRETLLKHARAPLFSGRLSGDDVASGTCRNPICNDVVLVTARFQGDRAIELRNQTQGCSMSTASASMMTEFLQGRTRDEIERLSQLFTESLQSSHDAIWPMELEALAPLSHLRVSPSRIPCAMIGWIALKEMLKARPS